MARCAVLIGQRQMGLENLRVDRLAMLVVDLGVQDGRAASLATGDGRTRRTEHAHGEPDAAIDAGPIDRVTVGYSHTAPSTVRR